MIIKKGISKVKLLSITLTNIYSWTYLHRLRFLLVLIHRIKKESRFTIAKKSIIFFSCALQLNLIQTYTIMDNSYNKTSVIKR